MSTLAATSAPARRSARWVLLPLSVAALVAVAIGLVARSQSTASGSAEGTYFDFVFSDPIHMKAWLATIAGVLAFSSSSPPRGCTGAFRSRRARG